MYIRTVKIRSSNGTINEYVRIVEAYRQDGKVKQRTIADLGRKDLLIQMLPNLQRILLGLPKIANDTDTRTDSDTDTRTDSDTDSVIEILDASTWGPVLAVRAMFEQLGLFDILDELLPPSRTDVSFTDRVFALVANRLIRPTSEHGLARWLETDFVCDRHGRRFVPHWQRSGRVQVHHRQLAAWYRTLDQLVKIQKPLEVTLYRHLRDLFSFKPDLVLFDITSTYFEGTGPADFAKHGYSRDGKSQNVQVVIGLVMVAGWPIAHHVWEGNRIDSTTVQEVVQDLMTRFRFARLVFVGDRGMVSDENLEALRREGHGYLVGLKRRRNAKLDGWLQSVDETKWVECPMGVTSRERKSNPLRTRVQEVTSGDDDQRVFVIDSDERRAYEQSKREQSQERARKKLLRLQERVASGELTDAAKVGAAAERALRGHKGYRYFAWHFADGVFTFEEHPVHFKREQRLEGRYVIATSERAMTAWDAVALYKQLTEVERGFRRLKDVLSMRPVYHRVELRVRAHVLVAVLGLLMQMYLSRRLEEGGIAMSVEQSLQVLETVRHVQFRVKGECRSGVSTANPRARQILKVLGIDDLRPPTPPVNEETIL